MNIDAKNIILPSLESSALGLFNRSLIIRLASIFMKLLSFEYRMKYKINARYSNDNNLMNIDTKRMIKLRLKSLRAGLSKDHKIIFLASIFAVLSSSVDNFIKILRIYL